MSFTVDAVIEGMEGTKFLVNVNNTGAVWVMSADHQMDQDSNKVAIRIPIGDLIEFENKRPKYMKFTRNGKEFSIYFKNHPPGEDGGNCDSTLRKWQPLEVSDGSEFREHMEAMLRKCCQLLLTKFKTTPDEVREIVEEEILEGQE